MGYWGVGITQCDEYGEIYDRFMEEYDEGKPVTDITNDILEEYIEQFGESDGILHDVYFALGKAEWMCGGVSDSIMERIIQIIENDENLEFWRELEADEKDIKQRKRALEKFLASLMIPRGKARKRKIPTEKYVAKAKPIPLPEVKDGDVLCYKCEGYYRVFALTERTRYVKDPAVYAYAWCEEFENVPTFDELVDKEIISLGYFRGKDFPDMNKITKIGNYSVVTNLKYVAPSVINKEWGPVIYALVTEEDLIKEQRKVKCLTLREALERVRALLDRRAALYDKIMDGIN